MYRCVFNGCSTRLRIILHGRPSWLARAQYLPGVAGCRSHPSKRRRQGTRQWVCIFIMENIICIGNSWLIKVPSLLLMACLHSLFSKGVVVSYCGHLLLCWLPVDNSFVQVIFNGFLVDLKTQFYLSRHLVFLSLIKRFVCLWNLDGVLSLIHICWRVQVDKPRVVAFRISTRWCFNIAARVWACCNAFGNITVVFLRAGQSLDLGDVRLLFKVVSLKH